MYEIRKEIQKYFTDQKSIDEEMFYYNIYMFVFDTVQAVVKEEIEKMFEEFKRNLNIYVKDTLTDSIVKALMK